MKVAWGQQKLGTHWPKDVGNGVREKRSGFTMQGRKRERASEGTEGMWKEAGQIYGDLYLIVHTKAIMG